MLRVLTSDWEVRSFFLFLLASFEISCLELEVAVQQVDVQCWESRLRSIFFLSIVKSTSYTTKLSFIAKA